MPNDPQHPPDADARAAKARAQTDKFMAIFSRSLKETTGKQVDDVLGMLDHLAEDPAFADGFSARERMRVTIAYVVARFIEANVADDDDSPANALAALLATLMAGAATIAVVEQQHRPAPTDIQLRRAAKGPLN